jgi:hypothetical protein
LLNHFQEQQMNPLFRNLGFIAAVGAGGSCNRADATAESFTTAVYESSLQCPGIPSLREYFDVADLFAVSDTTFGIVQTAGRRVVVFDSSFRAVKEWVFETDGPRGVTQPVSAAVSDTLLIVADEARAAIRMFTIKGDDAGTHQLSFSPRKVRVSGKEVFVAPNIIGVTPDQLLFRMSGGKPQKTGAEIARYEDPALNLLANMTSIAAFSDRIVVMHEMVVPFGYVVRNGTSEDSVRRFSIPIPRDVHARLDRLPAPPITEKNVNDLGIVAFTATANPKTGETWYIARSGNGRREPYRKLLVGLDSAQALAHVIPINVNPHQMAYLPSRNSMIVVDSSDEWFECKLPATH